MQGSLGGPVADKVWSFPNTHTHTHSLPTHRLSDARERHSNPDTTSASRRLVASHADGAKTTMPVPPSSASGPPPRRCPPCAATWGTSSQVLALTAFVGPLMATQVFICMGPTSCPENETGNKPKRCSGADDETVRRCCRVDPLPPQLPSLPTQAAQSTTFGFTTRGSSKQQARNSCTACNNT